MTEPYEVCGCGKPTRYVLNCDDDPVYSCNRVARCPNYDELRSITKSLANALEEIYNFGTTSTHYRYKERSKLAFKAAGELLDKYKHCLSSSSDL